MNQYTLEMQTHRAPEVLERILRVIRHRGFEVKSMQMDQLANNQLKIQLIVASERAISLLLTQLSKLIDVAHINEQLPTSQQQRA